MYFPYLRGKQFELIALRELVSLPLDPDKIVPIIEPVKNNLSSLRTALKVLSTAGIRVQLIVNPEFGDLKKNSEPIFEIIQEFKQLGVESILPTYLIKADRDSRFGSAFTVFRASKLLFIALINVFRTL